MPKPITPSKIEIKIGKMARTYELYVTNAPRAADYEHSAIQIYDGLDAKGEGERYVLIENTQAAYQLARYGSFLGKYGKPSDELNESDLTDWMMKAMKLGMKEATK